MTVTIQIETVVEIAIFVGFFAIFKTWSAHAGNEMSVSLAYQWISKNEVSKCAKVHFTSCDNLLVFLQDDLIFEMYIL